MSDTLTSSKLAAAAGISAGYASHILTGRRVPPQPLALRIWRATGAKFGVLAAMTDSQVDSLSALFPEANEVAA